VTVESSEFKLVGCLGIGLYYTAMLNVLDCEGQRETERERERERLISFNNAVNC